MNKQYIFLIIGALLSGSAVRADNIFDQPLAPEVQDERIMALEDEITMVSSQLKQAQETDAQDTVIQRLETRLKELFKDLRRRIKELEKKGFTPIVNRALFTDIEWRIKQRPPVE